MLADSNVLLITGASSGIGAETARDALKSRWQVVLAARRGDELQALSDELGGISKALPVVCDVTSWDAQQNMVAKALAILAVLMRCLLMQVWLAYLAAFQTLNLLNGKRLY